MNLLTRFVFYLIGLVLGCAFLLMFFGNRYMSCAYFPNARVLQYINQRKIHYGKEALLEMKKLKLDSPVVQHILHRGHVNFSKSQPRKKPCKTYQVEGDSIYIQVQTCKGNRLATIRKVAQLN